MIRETKLLDSVMHYYVDMITTLGWLRCRGFDLSLSQKSYFHAWLRIGPLQIWISLH